MFVSFELTAANVFVPYNINDQVCRVARPVKQKLLVSYRLVNSAKGVNCCYVVIVVGFVF